MINNCEAFEKLSGPIEVSVRGFDQNKYIEHSKVTERLNEVFGLDWNFELVDKFVDMNHNEIATIVRIHYPTENGMRFKDGAAGAWYEPKIGVGNALKSSMSKALVKAASLMGITIREIPPEPITQEKFKKILELASQLEIKYDKNQKTKLTELTIMEANAIIEALEKKVTELG